MKSQAGRSNSPRATLNVLAGLLVVVCYLVGIASFEGIHEKFHSISPADLHSIISEADPCHRSLFHNDQDNGCHHKTHLTQSDTCSLCGLGMHSVFINEVLVKRSANAVGKCVVSRSSHFEPTPLHYALPSRAPPVA